MAMELRTYSHNYLFVSDLHLSEGRHPETGKLSRNEDFFHDDAFAGFVVHHLQLGSEPDAAAEHSRPWKLFINGDLFDFLQVTSLPAEGDELEWVTGKRRYEDLTSNERSYGLGTSSRATLWKLSQIYAGHELFFQALGWFLARDPENELVVIKGNHDVELFWPAVQQYMRRLVARAYSRWHQAVTGGDDLESPLPLLSGLPDTLEREALSTRILFPAWFHYEPGLFYAEHGNQYDPTNAFLNFLNPVMQPEPGDDADGKPPLIALPSGSFFVRYFFNKVEQVHPFADNIKPVGRYLRWAVTKEPLATARLLFTHRNELPDIWRNLNSKNASLEGTNELKECVKTEGKWQNLMEHEEQWPTGAKAALPAQPSLDKARRKQIDEMRKDHLQQAMEATKDVKRGTFSGLGIQAGTGLALLQAIRDYVEGNYRGMGLDLILASGGYFAGTWLSNRLNQVDKYVDLPGVGQKIAEILNRPLDGSRQSVRYHIFGHDHLPDLVELIDEEHGPEFRQWYVNTGCWLSSFDEAQRLIRGDVRFIFLRIIPPDPAQPETALDDQVPELLEWLPNRQTVRPILMFTPPEETATGVGFQVEIADLPEVTA